MANKKPTSNLNADTILKAEFDYAATSAFQANEDRVKLFNYFLASAGTLVAAVSLDDLAGPELTTLFSIIFFGLAIYGFISFLMLIKIRIAWKSSIKAMNQIKTYYIQNLRKAELAKAFKWSNLSAPPLNKPWSISFLMTIILIVINSFSIGAGLWYSTGTITSVTLLVLSGVITLHFGLWFYLLRENK